MMSRPREDAACERDRLEGIGRKDQREPEGPPPQFGEVRLEVGLHVRVADVHGDVLRRKHLKVTGDLRRGLRGQPQVTEDLDPPRSPTTLLMQHHIGRLLVVAPSVRYFVRPSDEPHRACPPTPGHRPLLDIDRPGEPFLKRSWPYRRAAR